MSETLLLETDQTKTGTKSLSVTVLNSLQIGAWIYLIFLGGRLAYAWSFSDYEPYDDEGYLALSLRSYFKNLPLYTSTFSQYGPFYYLFNRALYGIAHIAVTTDNVRFVTIGHWLATSILSSVAVWRMTGVLLWAVVAFFAIFFHLSPLISEPGHPQGLILSLTAGLFLVASFYRQEALRRILPVLAALLACISLTKINIGGYLCFAVLVTAFARSRSIRIRLPGMLVMLLSMTIPLAVTLPYIRSWAGPLAAVVALSIASECLVLSFSSSDHYGLIQLKEGIPAILTFLVISLAIIGTILAQGTTASSAIAAIVTRPAHMASLFFMPVRLAQSTVTVGIAGLLSAGIYTIFLLRKATKNTLLLIITSGKIIWGATIIWLLCTGRSFFGLGLPQLAISFAAPFTWLLLVPSLEAERNPFPRTLLATASVFEVLLIYPVAGTQYAFSTFLFLPAGVVSLADGLADLWALIKPFVGQVEIGIRRTQHVIELRLALVREGVRGTSPLRSNFAQTLMGCLLVCIFGVYAYPRISSGNGVRHRYKKMLVPSYLSGAEHSRMRFDDAGRYHWLISSIEANCESFVAEPGLGSLHLWTGLAPLTGLNVTNWMQLLSPKEQELILAKLKAQERACVVYNGGIAGWWTQFKTEFPTQPLVAYIQHEFHPALANGGFELWLPNKVKNAPENFLLLRKTRFDSQPGYAVPSEFIFNGTESTLSLWFRTKDAGALLGCQNVDNLTETPSEWLPTLYVNTDGRLSAQYYAGRSEALTAGSSVNDDTWHQVALVTTGNGQLLYLDGSYLGRIPSKVQDSAMKYCEIGDGFTAGWPKSNNSWMRFKGLIARAQTATRALDAGEIRADYQGGP
jgi:hypothetical protein